MPSKRRLEQLKSARAVMAQAHKKRKSEVSSVLDAHHPEIEDDKLSTADTSDTSDTEGESGIWFWNESVNESGSDTVEGEEDNENESDLEIEETRAVSPEAPEKEIKWNKEGEDRLRGVYGIGSRSLSKRQRKSARELEEQASKTYDISALWQRNRGLGMISFANSQIKLGQLSKSQPNDGVSSTLPLSKIARGGASLPSNQETLKSQRTGALENLNKLLKLVTEQDKKYGTRLSPHSNFYRRHIMVQQFFQSQLTTQPSLRRRTLSLNVARSFGRGNPTARNSSMEREWVGSRKIPERKEREDSDSWIYNGDLNDAMREFVRMQGDSKYTLIYI